MMLGWPRAVSLVNARVLTPQGIATSIRFRTRVLAIDELPRPGDRVFDLEGAFVLPGLINAHDHLELNHYGRLKQRDRYENASAWIDDMRVALQHDGSIRRNQAYPLADRLFIGTFKNLLAGVTTVAHHNPWYRALDEAFIRVVKRYGWAHSLALERQPVGAHGEPGGRVGHRYTETPSSLPFVLHAAEGTDEAARSEFPELERLGCVKSNTVLVHGVALTAEMWRRACAADAGLVWCPASNQFLFGRTIPTRGFLDACGGARLHIALGSDSRVTGARDLLDEIRVGAASLSVSPAELLQMVTVVPASLFRLPEAGRIAVGVPADLFVLGARNADGCDVATALVTAMRKDVSLVTVGGRPLVGAPELAGVFSARGRRTGCIAVDGVRKVADAALTRVLVRCTIREPGVEWAD